MNKKSRFSWDLALYVLMLLALLMPSSAWAGPVGQTPTSAPVDQEVRDQIKAEGSADFWVVLDAQADLSVAERIPDWTARGQYVVDRLQAVANETQPGVISVLAKAEADYKSYWVTNAIWVNGDKTLVDSLSSLSEVAMIKADRTISLTDLKPTPEEDQVNAVEWNIDRINAPLVWSTFDDTGQGIVVATIDSGVQYDHPALVGQYRGNLSGENFDHNYNWFDPLLECGNPSLVPCDTDGHGTRIIGTLVGDDGGENQIGVAPGARFIIAKGCCSTDALLASAQWILAPTDLSGANPRSDLRPNIVNNSWASSSGDFLYEAVVQAWVASGIFPVFAIGNSGSGCSTSLSPGDYLESYAAGAFDIDNHIAGFSSRGPATGTGIIKPNIAAPGVSVRTSTITDTYDSYDGTGMASPHVAGTVALMWSANPALVGDIAATRAILDQTAIDKSNLTCGGTADNNNVWGEGRLDAYAAVMQSLAGSIGVLQGTVMDADTNLPVAGVAVQAVGPITHDTTADAAGFYSFPILLAGNYDVTVSKFGYQSQTTIGVVVAGDGTTVQDFSLSPAEMVTVEGTVTDGSGHPSMPLYARLDISGYPDTPIFTDPATGYYSLELPEGEAFTFIGSTITPGYNTASRDITPPPGGSAEDFTLTVDEAACVAPGYIKAMDGLYESFEIGYLPDGWSSLDNTGGGGWFFYDYMGRGNLTGGDGLFAILDSDYYGGRAFQDAELITPLLDFSALSSVSLEFDTDFTYYSFGLDEAADVDVSNDGGVSWNNVWSKSGASYPGPAHEVVDITALAAGQPDVMARFHYYNANYEWWWQVDNVYIGATRLCEPIPGGMLVGNVYDLNTSGALNEAQVASDGAPDTATTGETPDNSNLDDGFYMLFSTLTGAQPFTASMSGGYGDVTEQPTVVADGAARQDFYLPAGLVAADPTSLEVTLDIGDTTTQTFTLTNSGSQEASFKLWEHEPRMTFAGQPGPPITHISGHFTPYRLDAGLQSAVDGEPPRSIDSPTWVDIADYPIYIYDNTADSFDGRVFSVGGFGFSDPTGNGYVYDPATDAWASIAGMNARQKPAAAFVGEKLYVVGGWPDSGNTVEGLDIYDPATDSWSSGEPVPTPYAAATAVSLEGQFYVMGGCPTKSSCGTTDVFRYDPTGDSWTALAPYPEPVSWQACGVIDDQIYCAGGYSDALGASLHTYVYNPSVDAWSQLADMPQTLWGMGYAATNGLLYISGGVTGSTITNETFVYDPMADTWTPDANSNNTLYRGGSACGFYRIGGIGDYFIQSASSEVYPGLDECGGAGDVPWVSAAPVKGSLPASGGSQEIEVTFDASVPGANQPGTFQAQLRVTTDTPFDVEPVQLTMNVNPPATWGKLTGTVNGLALCDLPGAPLANATVEITGVISLKSDLDGAYSYWLEQGDYTLNVSAGGYIAQTVEVSVNAGGTSTTDFDLRLDEPCASRTPDAFDKSVPEGGSDSDTLEIANTGAGELSYHILESVYDLTLPPTTELPAPGERDYALPAVEGPASVLSQAGAPQLVGEAPEVPDSGWLGGLELPGGVRRYASAQCYEQPDSFYVISGVDSTFNVTSKTWRFDAADNAWTELAPIPAGQESPTAVCYMGKIYVMGGGGTDQFYIYDIATDTWSAGAALPRGSVGAASSAWNGKVYLIGGDNDFYPSSGVSDQVDIYDIASDTWLGNGAAMPVGTSFPGAVQAGPYVYVAGGWGLDAPRANVSATLRYDMAKDIWENGPAFSSARADFALAVTDQALYAIAGDKDDFGFFDPSNLFERLDLTNWPGGAWTDTSNPLPIQVTSNNAGFCTQAFENSAVWSVGGGNLNIYEIYGSTLFNITEGETCYSIYSDVSWLAEDPAEGLVSGDTTQPVTVDFDASGLAIGVYQASLMLVTDDPRQILFQVPVTLTVGEKASYKLFLNLSLKN